MTVNVSSLGSQVVKTVFIADLDGACKAVEESLVRDRFEPLRCSNHTELRIEKLPDTVEPLPEDPVVLYWHDLFPPNWKKFQLIVASLLESPGTRVVRIQQQKNPLTFLLTSQFVS